MVKKVSLLQLEVNSRKAGTVPCFIQHYILSAYHCVQHIMYFIECLLKNMYGYSQKQQPTYIGI